MSKTEKIDPITESTLAQLLDVYSQLSTQEAQLQEQLESIQQKRQSLQVVIDLFSKTEKAHVADSEEEAIATPQPPTEKQLESVEEKIAPPQTTSQSQTSAPSLTETSKGQKTISSKKKSQAKKSSSKTVKHNVGWQQYLRSEFRNRSLPQAISLVLHSQEERVWDIPSVVDAIFVEQIPNEVKKKVRLQITNLLAQGVRENKWYRGQQGSYTLSQESVT